MSADPSKQVKLGYVSGLVSREKSMAFERILFRATRGNVFLKQVVLDDTVIDPVSGEKVSSCTSLCWCNFILFFNLHVILHYQYFIIIVLLDNYFQVEKNVFITFYSGERARNKILKICDAFGANRYPFMDDIGKQYQIITEV